MTDYAKYRPRNTIRSRPRIIAPGLLLAVLFVSGLVGWLLIGSRNSANLPAEPVEAIAQRASAAGSTNEAGLSARRIVTFNKDIAPLVFEHCAVCHRVGEAAPFQLLRYEDVKTRVEQIVEVTGTRFMPPWLPEPGYGEFAGERRLTDEQIELIRHWADQGAIQGDPSDLPLAPRFTEGWRLGDPDLVVQLPRAYTLPAEGTDVFRNFVIPIPVQSPRFVKRVELRPGNKAVVHHANMLIDRSGESRRLDQQDAEPGFDGMETVGQAHFPGGHLLSWKPGTAPYSGREDKSWRLEIGTDLVVNMHMIPSGRPEQIQPTVGFYFTDKPPTPPAFGLLQLENDGALDIPPGVRDFVVTDTFRLPVDVEVVRLYPHAHLLGKDLQGYATLPDGSKKWLFWIKEWDWNWQAVYRYATPLQLPKGSILSMRYTFDNSAENIRNPNQPPQRVVAGNQTTDEMGHLWIQVLPRTEEDRHILSEWRARHRLRKYPHIIAARYVLGTVLVAQGRLDEAIREFREVLSVNPNYPEANYELARTLQLQGDVDEAVQTFRLFLELKPNDANAHYFLAHALQSRREFDEALRHFQRAVQIKPDFFGAHLSLGTVLAERNKLGLAIESWRRAVQIKPDYVDAHFNLGMALNDTDQSDQALKHFREVTRRRPVWADPWNAIARILAIHPDAKLRDPEQAISHALRAVELSKNENPQMLETLAAAYAAASQFKLAVATAEKALEIASRAKAHEAANRIRKQLQLYKAGKPLNSTGNGYRTQSTSSIVFPANGAATSLLEGGREAE